MSSSTTPSISIVEKPTKHLSVAHWHGRVHNLRVFADEKRQDASVLRSETHQTRNEAEIASNWSHYHTNARITERIAEIRHWLQLLQNALFALEEETALLTDEKAAAEREIEAYYRALTVVYESLSSRDKRGDKDLTYDAVFKELKLELDLLESSKQYLTEKSTEAWDLLTQMRAVAAKLRHDIADKTEALDIDSKTLALTKESSQVSYKPDILRLPLEIVAYETWVQEAQSKQEEADNHTAQSAKLRETLRLGRDRAKMDYLTQVEATNYALRKRLHDANRMKNELEWQRKNTMEEMARVMEELDRLRACLAVHEDKLKCAETRHENRNMRPCMELARDEAQLTLVEEISHLRRLTRDLREKIDTAVNAYNQLETLLVKLDHEIASKQHCIQCEMRALDARKNLVEHLPISQMDKDIVLVKMEKQIAPPSV